MNAIKRFLSKTRNDTFFHLEELGSRVCIIGPSSSGKSTLASLLGKKIGAKVIHLDQIAHHPNTAWVRRPDADFVAEHDREIAQETWVIDGNYSICMPQRFARATAVIWLNPPLAGTILRYILRCLKNDPARQGGLVGANKEFRFFLLKYTLVNYPKNRIKYRALLERHDIPVLHMNSIRLFNRYVRHWVL